MRLYISADIEGIAGVVTRDHIFPEGFEYERARHWMTEEVAAACEAAKEAGVEEIVISDSHGNGENLFLERFPKGTQVIRSWPRPLVMMQGLETGPFDAAMLIGYHAGSTAMGGIMAHTITGKIREIRLNGEVASETVISAAVAAHFDVPVVLATGDDVYCAHARGVFGDIETAEVKWAHGTLSARTMRPEDACDLVREKAAAALARLGEFKPRGVATPVTLEIDFKGRMQPELLGYLPNVERTAAYTVRFVAADMVEASKFLEFATTYNAND
jgi:D-amino peptidase